MLLCQFSGNQCSRRHYSVCEVYLDNKGRLEAWTENSAISPSGYSSDELVADLGYMLDDVSKWKPVAFESMNVGMGFEAAL